MDVTLRPHQQRFIEKNPNRALLLWEMRVGKSLPAKLWTEHPIRNAKAVVVCLKQNKKDWEKLCPDATVKTKEEFKRDWKDISMPTCIVVDEAHNFAAPLFITKKRSQLAESLYNFIKKHSDIHVLLLTATPLTNDPASLHTLLTYIGLYCDWKNYQKRFYELQYKPFLPRPAWFPKPRWRDEANKILESREEVDIVSLKDCVDSLPLVIEETIVVRTEPYHYAEDEDYHWTKDHKAEQVGKDKEIKRLGTGHRKLIVVCNYTEQIDELDKSLSKDKPTFVLDGRTKDPDKVKREAQEASDCYFIVQAKMGFGWDGYMFGAMVFCSMWHRVIDYEQMLGRLTSVDNPKPCVYYYLVSDKKWDKLILRDLKAGYDFSPHKYE